MYIYVGERVGYGFINYSLMLFEKISLAFDMEEMSVIDPT
jgi:hypothetical protein